ncbi:hypothetical protein BS78_02G286900 [Paspalum vaginatum]|nr:hypothetical protein BS78_02G286900 [Paspalum vaginatum]
MPSQNCCLLLHSKVIGRSAIIDDLLLLCRQLSISVLSGVFRQLIKDRRRSQYGSISSFTLLHATIVVWNVVLRPDNCSQPTYAMAHGRQTLQGWVRPRPRLVFFFFYNMAPTRLGLCLVLRSTRPRSTDWTANSFSVSGEAEPAPSDAIIH